MDTITDYATLLSDIERDRFHLALDVLSRYCHLFEGKRVLDFGANRGLSAVALIDRGAASVVGVEPSLDRVKRGWRDLALLGYSQRIELTHKEDTTRLEFPAASFEFVNVNAVLEHIDQPRDAYLREIWRVLKPGGHLLITDTPNKYWPRDTHTTGLWFNHWLPKRAAHRRAVRLKRFRADRTDWDSSGWRGLGYFELVRPLSDYRLIPERTRSRHRVLSALGIPASIIDPYPVWLLQKL